MTGNAMSERRVGENVESGSARGEALSVPARLCYVDDSRTSAYVVRRLLEPLGYRVDHFSSAEPAFVALVQEDYDLLLTDLKVSATGMDGDDLIRTLRQSGHPKISTLPIIVITGSTDAEVLVKVYDAGANQVMNKPVDADELDGHIRRLLFEGRHAGPATTEPAPPEAGEPAAEAPPEPIPEPIPETIPESIPETPPETGKVVPIVTPVTPPAAPAEPEVPVLGAVQPPPGPGERAPTPERVGAFFHEQTTRSRQGQDSAGPDMAPAPSHEPEPAPQRPAAASGRFDWEDDEDEVVIIEPDGTGPGRAKHSPGFGAAASRHRFHPRDDYLDEDEEVIIDPDHSLVATQGRGLFSARGARTSLIRAVLLGLVLAAAVLGWQQFADRGEPVETVVASRGEIQQSLRVAGRVVSRQRADVAPASAGRVVEILVNEGDAVSAGQLLARLDDRELQIRLNRVRAGLKSAREGISQAQRNLDRLRKAHQEGAVAQRFVDDAEAKLRSARGNAGIAVEDVHSATLALENLAITAPIDGVVVARNADVGQWVGPTDSLFTLEDPTQSIIEARVDAADGASITAGQIVHVSSEAAPGQPWQEAVARVGAADPQDPDGVKVFISLGPDAPPLRLGQPVDAEIRTAWNPRALKLPFDALISRDGQTLVAVLEQGRVRLRKVETGIEGLAMAEIRQGLNPGEQVILANGRRLMDGDRVYAAQAAD